MGKIKEKFIEEQEENRRMDMDYLDFQSRKGRLSKKYEQGIKNVKNEYIGELAEGDDSWGFYESPLKLRAKFSKTEKVIYLIIIGYFVWYIFEAIKFIF